MEPLFTSYYWCCCFTTIHFNCSFIYPLFYPLYMFLIEMGTSWVLWTCMVFEELCDARSCFWKKLYNWIKCCSMYCKFFCIMNSHSDSSSILDCALFDSCWLYIMSIDTCNWFLYFDAYHWSNRYDGFRYYWLIVIHRCSKVLYPSV